MITRYARYFLIVLAFVTCEAAEDEACTPQFSNGKVFRARIVWRLLNRDLSMVLNLLSATAALQC